MSVFRDNKLERHPSHLKATPKPSQSHAKATSKTPKDLQTTQSPLKAASKIYARDSGEMRGAEGIFLRRDPHEIQQRGVMKALKNNAIRDRF